jgi:hypothetical protein
MHAYARMGKMHSSVRVRATAAALSGGQRKGATFI